MLLYDVRDEAHFLPGEHHAGGVAGIGNQNTPGVGVDVRLNEGALRVMVAVFGRGGDGMNFAAGHVGKSIVVGVIGLRHQQLVPLVQNAGEDELQRLAAAGGCQNVILIQLHTQLCVIRLHRLDVCRQAGSGRIFQRFGLEITDRLVKGLRRFHIRLADIQMIDHPALCRRCLGAGIKLTHGGQLAFLHFTGKSHGKTPPYKLKS